MLAIGYDRFGKQDPFYHFQGSIDDVGIYDRPLDASKISRLYEGAFNPASTREYEDVAYGPHERNVLDFRQAESDEPTPVVVSIHGGGFRTGDKRTIRTPSGLADVEQYLQNGIAFAAMNSREDLELYGIEDRSRLCDPDIVAMRAFLDMPALMAANDPPLYTHNLRPDTDPRNAGEVIHHPRHAICLKQQCELFGIPCTAVLADTPLPERIRLVDFFVEQPTGFGESVNDISP